MNRAQATGGPVRNVLVKLVPGDGPPAWNSINASPLFRHGETRPYAVVTPPTDVTRHVHAEQELPQVNEGLERRVCERTADMRRAVDAAQKASRAKSEFLSRMCHELRTPLNAILGFSQLLAMPRTGLGEPEMKKLRQIEMAGWHVLELINEVLGPGSGLVITRRLVELMGGELTVASAEGAGSTFSVDPGAGRRPVRAGGNGHGREARHQPGPLGTEVLATGSHKRVTHARPCVLVLLRRAGAADGQRSGGPVQWALPPLDGAPP